MLVHNANGEKVYIVPNSTYHSPETRFGTYETMKKAEKSKTAQEIAEENQKKVEDNRKKAAVAEKVTNLGSHREKEAEKFIEMQEAAKKARSFNDLSSKIDPVYIEPPPKKNNDEVCTYDQSVTKLKTGESKALNSRNEVEKSIHTLYKHSCYNAGQPIVRVSSCKPYRAYTGKPIAVNGKLIYKEEDYTNGFKCSYTFKCSEPKKVCKSNLSPAKVNRQ